MNLVVVVLDSFRQDFVSHYHGDKSPFEDLAPVSTPNLDAFAAQSVVFRNAYPEALPTMPVRLQLMTGQRTLHARPWGALGPGDVTIADILRGEGYVSGLITDNYHFRGPGMNFFRSFNAYRWIRGQEYDPYESAPPTRDLAHHTNEHYNEVWQRLTRQCLANMNQFRDESDWFAAQVVDEGIAWLRANRSHKKLFAWIELFDPHEPWLPPPRFDTFGDPKYDGKEYVLPLGGLADKWATPHEQRRVRSLYAGECALVDDCLGRLFRYLEADGFYDDSVILLLADHGHPLGDHGKFLKGSDRLYNELLRVPYFIRLPGGRSPGGREAIVQFHDTMPTLLDLLGITGLDTALAGRSFRRVLDGELDTHRDAIISGYHEGVDRVVRDAKHSLILRPEGQADELYDLEADPRERNNLIDERSAVAIELAGKFGGQFFKKRVPQVEGVQGKYEIQAGTA